MGKGIELMVNRHMMQIPASSIVYANVTDKLCKIHLDNEDMLSLFITISDLMEKLGDMDFLRVSRSSLVAYTAVESVNMEEVVLHGGIRIPYSRSRRREIMEKARRCMERQIVCRDKSRPMGKLDFNRDFSFWDELPVGFCVLGFVADHAGGFSDFVFRYANRAFADIEGISMEGLLNRTYGQVFPGAQSRRLAIYSKVAFMGDTVELIDKSPEIDKELLVVCYQPAYGYCACMVCDATNKYYLQMKR